MVILPANVTYLDDIEDRLAIWIAVDFCEASSVLEKVDSPPVCSGVHATQRMVMRVDDGALWVSKPVLANVAHF